MNGRIRLSANFVLLAALLLLAAGAQGEDSLSTPAPVSTMTPEQAAALFDYRQYSKVRDGMRLWLRDHPNDPAARSLLRAAQIQLGEAEPRPEATAPATATSTASVPLTAAAPLSPDEAAGLLDYRQYGRVADGLRLWLRHHPYDGRGWQLLAEAEAGLGQREQAEQDAQHARQLGAGEKRWHGALLFGALVDSNVVVAPDGAALTAADRGDIGARVALLLDFSPTHSGLGPVSLRLRLADGLYQNFNRYALQRVGGELAQEFELDPLQAEVALLVERMAMGGSPLYNDLQGELRLFADDAGGPSMRLSAGRRNFSQNYRDLSARRLQAALGQRWRQPTWGADLRLDLADEHAQSPFESFRLYALRLGVEQQLPVQLVAAPLWFSAAADFGLRTYRQRDSRPFLRQPLQRRDRRMQIDAEFTWRRDRAFWGGDLPERWAFSGSWLRNRSNMSGSALIDPAQSRSWARWMSEVKVQWQF